MESINHQFYIFCNPGYNMAKQMLIAFIPERKVVDNLKKLDYLKTPLWLKQWMKENPDIQEKELKMLKNMEPLLD